MEFLIIAAMAWAVMRRRGDITAAGGGTRPGPAGGPRVGKYGMWDQVVDSYRDSWRRETDAMIARRDARAASRPATASWWRRHWDAAEDRVATREEAKRPPATTQTTGTTAPPRSSGQAPGATGAPDEVERRRKLREARDRAGQPAPTSTPATPPRPTPVATTPPASSPNPEIDEEPTTEPAPPTTSKGEETMTAPSGEVTNYETAIANCDATDAHLKGLKAKAEYALVQIEGAKDAVNAVQGDHVPAANAAQTTADHEAALNLDSQTQGHSADMTDALRPSDCDAMYGSMEVVEQGIRAQIARYDQAIAANAAKKANLQSKYADANDTVNGDLSGDSRFLGNGNGAPTGPGSMGGTLVPELTGEDRESPGRVYDNRPAATSVR